MTWLTKAERRNLWRIFWAIPIRKPGDRWGYWQLYVLALQDGCYYVGITRFRDVQHRYKQHLDGKGSKWTKAHPPLRLMYSRPIGHIKETEAVVIETNETIQLIAFYGVDRVRGGRLVNMNPNVHRRQYEKLKNHTRQNWLKVS